MIHRIALCVFACLWLAPVPAAETRATAEPPQNILFVGNSLTMYNNAIYTHLRRFLVADDPDALEKVFLKAMMISGGLLADHRGGLMQILDSRRWDVVVLQGHSREALDEDMAEAFASTAYEYTGAIRATGAKPVLFMTWAYAEQPQMTPRLAGAYTKLGEELQTLVVPVGLAFDRARQAIRGVQLYLPDGIHPTLEGTYLATAVFYAALFGKSPVDLDYDAGLDKALARQLRELAWQTTQQNPAN